jgi:hypothetical protein
MRNSVITITFFAQIQINIEGASLSGSGQPSF